MYQKKYKSYKFGSESALKQETLDKFITLFQVKDNKRPETILTGRNSVIETTINEFGPLIIKKYTRGGFVSFINKHKYVYSKKSRSEIEFTALTQAQKAGVSVPEPIAYAIKGSVFYEAWLILKKIDNSKNYVEICLENRKLAINLLPEICNNINKLMNDSIYHPDLHPGNILLDKQNNPYIIDFDKAGYFSGSRQRLIQKYEQRWQRAIKKYNLPEELLNLQLAGSQ